MLLLSPCRSVGVDVVRSEALGRAVLLVSHGLSKLPATQLENAESTAQKSGSHISADEMHADVERRNSIYNGVNARMHHPGTSGASLA